MDFTDFPFLLFMNVKSKHAVKLAHEAHEISVLPRFEKVRELVGEIKYTFAT